MTKDDVLFGYRLQLLVEAARTNVSAACRTFGVHRSTYYACKRQVDRHCASDSFAAGARTEPEVGVSEAQPRCLVKLTLCLRGDGLPR
jgi:transposase-like protein